MIYITLNTLKKNGVTAIAEKVFNAETIMPSLKAVPGGTQFDFAENINRMLQINTWVVSETVAEIILLIQANNTQALITNIDTTIPGVAYVGSAAIGSSGASPVWRIKRIDGFTDLEIRWAGGTTSFNNIWDNRASLIYS